MDKQLTITVEYNLPYSEMKLSISNKEEVNIYVKIYSSSEDKVGNENDLSDTLTTETVTLVNETDDSVVVV